MSYPAVLLFGSISTLTVPEQAFDPARRPTLRGSAIRLLDEAKSLGIRLGLISDLPSTVVASHVESLEPVLSEMDFSLITSRDVMPRPKPDPSLYEFALKQLGVSPDVCIAVEENHTAALASLRAGIRTMVVPDPTSPPFRSHDFDGAVRLRLCAREMTYG